MTLDIQNISKKYDKNKFGVKNLSLTIGTGIFGLLGPNGAGKSTLLKMIATVSKPTQGIISLNKNNIAKDPNYIRKQLGFLPQDFGVYANLNAYEFLAYMAALKGIGGPQLKLRIRSLLEGLNLIDVAKKPIGVYSGGMKQRIGIAQALLNDPKILIFDEPTVGLDPEERVRFRNLITDLANHCIVILSSHIVSDIDAMADSIAIMKNGSLLAHGNQGEIIMPVANKVFESVIKKDELANFKTQYTVVGSTRYDSEVTVRYIAKTPLVNSRKVVASLEDAYLYMTKTV